MNLSFEKSLQEKIQKGHFQPYISIKLGLPPPVTSDPYQIKSVKVRLLFSTYFFFFFPLGFCSEYSWWNEPNTIPDTVLNTGIILPGTKFQHLNLPLAWNNVFVRNADLLNFIHVVVFSGTFIKKNNKNNKVLLLSPVGSLKQVLKGWYGRYKKISKGRVKTSIVTKTCLLLSLGNSKLLCFFDS